MTWPRWAGALALFVVVLEAGSYLALVILRSRYAGASTGGISVTGWPRNSTIQFASGPVRVAYVLNDLGFRGPDPRPGKEPGTFRIAVFGDSFAEGWGVPQDQMFASRLQARLDRAQGAGKFEVVNFGTKASGPGTAYRIYLDIARRFEPDLVVLAVFVGNDFVDAETELARALRLEDRSPFPSTPRVPFTRALITAVLGRRGAEESEAREIARSPGYRDLDPGIRELLREGRLHVSMLHVGLTAPDALERALTRITPAQVRAFERIVQDFGDAVIGDRAAFVVLAIPVSVQVSREQVEQLRRMRFHVPDGLLGNRVPQELIARMLEPWIAASPARRASIRYVDPSPAFADRSRVEPLYLAYDAHLNDNGHALVADILFGEITSVIAERSVR